MKKQSYFLSGLVIILLSVNTLFAQSPGSLDFTFGGVGYVLTDFGISNIGSSVALQSDGKIVVCGTSMSGVSNLAVARYNTDGSLDESFGPSGLGYFSIVYGGTDETGTDIVIQPDGKILIAGYSFSSTNNADFVVVRLTEEGILDNTFSSDGTAVVSFGDADIANSILLQDDGKIILFGSTRNESEDHNIAICRLNSNGSMDTGFGSNGKTIVDINYGSMDFGRGIAISNSNIYGAALSYGDNDDDALVVLSFDSEGHMNTDFGDNGMAIISMEMDDMVLYANTDLAITQDNKIIVSTHETNSEGVDFAVARLLMNGFPDEDFGTHGIVITDMIGDNMPNAIVEQEDGKILLGGYHEDNVNGYDFTIARYLDNGDLDDSFGNHYGVTWENLSPYLSYPLDIIMSMVMQPDGKIVAVGYARGQNDFDFAVARFYSGLEVGVSHNQWLKELVNIYPNPVVNNVITVSYELEHNSNVEITIYDLLGREVQKLASAKKDAGSYKETFTLLGVKSGVYFVETAIADRSSVSKIVINR